jgi:hypothetical protein
MAEYTRTDAREDAILPLRLHDGGIGVTRDVSTSGVYFVSDAEQAVGSEIDFTIDFETPSGPLHLKCHGQVVRTEKRGSRIGHAVKILESRFATGHSGFGDL